MKDEGRRKESGSRPLEGKRVVVTRATDQSETLCKRLAALGAEPIVLPTIQFVSLPTGPLATAVKQLEQYNWLLFTSANAVDFFFRFAGTLEERPSLPRLAAVGPATAARLYEQGLMPDVMPHEYVGEALADALGELAGQRVLLPRSRKGRPQLVELLLSKGAIVDEIAIYDTLPADPQPEALDAIIQGIDAVTFTSPSTVRGFLTILNSTEIQQSLSGEVVVACIGPVTAREVEEAGFAGFKVTITAREQTAEGLMKALMDYYAN